MWRCEEGWVGGVKGEGWVGEESDGEAEAAAAGRERDGGGVVGIGRQAH